MSNEMRKLWYKLLDKWFFPDFFNKITWLVLTVGISFLLVSKPVVLFTINWLIDVLNLNLGLPFELPDIEASNDYTVGILLVLLALLHNLGYKYFSFRKEAFEHQISKERKTSDYKLFETFLGEISSECNSLVLLKDHDFGAPFFKIHLDQIECFTRRWHASEFFFQDEVIDEHRASLLKSSKEFLNKLASSISPVGTSDIYRVVPVQFVGKQFPEWVQNEIKSLNDMATKLYQEHQEFITLAKGRL
jgi:hypothetical protein